MQNAGIYVALVTPFNDDYSVDYNGLSQLIEYQIENNVTKFVVCGSTGEGTLLSIDERRKITVKTKEIVGTRGLVGVGCSAGSIDEAVSLISLANSCNADFALVAPPYYIKPTQDGIVRFYQEITKRTDIPIVAYNIPGRVSVNMSFDTLVKISKLRNIIGVKDATTHFDVISQTSSVCGSDFVILSGDDLTFPASLMYGACGTISAIANYCPYLICEFYEYWKKGLTALLPNIVKKIEIISRINSLSSNPIPLKYIMSKQGLIKNVLRPPLLPLEPDKCKLVNSILETIA